MAWIKKNAKLFVSTGIALLMGLIAGIGIQKTAAPAPMPAQTENPAHIASEPVGKIGKPAILPTTLVEMRYTFLLCGHEIRETQADGILTGCTLEDVQSRLPGARVIKLNASNATVALDLECYCPEHYVLFLNGEDTLCISYTDPVHYGEEHVRRSNSIVRICPRR